MLPIMQELAARSYNYYAEREAEIHERDKGEQSELTPAERGMVDFMSRWMAGSLFLDMFMEDGLRRLFQNVFENEATQVFVFDLYYHATVGVTVEEMATVRASISRAIAPGFIPPKADGYGQYSAIGIILNNFEFSDAKWQLKAKDIEQVLEYMPWLIPLLLIRLGGEIVGTYPDTDVPG